MKWRYQSIAVLLCGVLTLANSSPAGKKDLLDSDKVELEKKINPSESHEADGTEETDDLLARAKKSSITTFCVEIKPGNDQPAVVVCDPSKSESQVPIPNPSYPPPPPAPVPHPEPPHFFNPPFGDLIPQFLPEFQPPPPAAYEPLIYIPQQPQIIPSFYPQILPPYSQPQVIVVRDPSCPSSNPSIVSSFLQSGLSPARLYSSRSFDYPMDAANLWKTAYNPEEEAMRSVAGTNLLGGGMMSNGYSSPLNMMESASQGDFQQSQYTNMRTLPRGSSLINGNQNPMSMFNGQYLVKCNPTLTPLPQNQYGTASVAGKMNEQQDSKTVNMGPLVSGGYQSQYSSGGQGHHGIQSTYDTTHYNRGLQTHNNHHYQSNAYPHNMHLRMMSGDGVQQQRAAEESQIKTGQDMSMQQGQMSTDSFAKIISGQQLGGQSQPGSQSSFNNPMNQGAASGFRGDGRVLIDQKQQKMGSDKPMGSSRGSESRFYSSSFGQGQNGERMRMVDGKDQGLQKQMGFPQNQQQQSSFVNGGGSMQSADLKDQGPFQKQMSFSQTQQDAKMIPNAPLQTAGSQQKNSEQQQLVSSDMPSYSQMLMQRMKSAVAQNNLVQPFMASPSDLTGNKSTQSKV